MTRPLRFGLAAVVAVAATAFAAALAAAPACHPLADAGGPYTLECAQPLLVALDGSGSQDCRRNPLTFSWTSDCPGASFDDPSSPRPVLRLDVPPPCPVRCQVKLVVSDPFRQSSDDTAAVTIADTTPPVISGCALAPVLARGRPPRPPARPGSLRSGRYRVDCGALTDACDPQPTTSALLHVTRRPLAPGGGCADAIETVAVACGELLDLRLTPGACAPPLPPSPASSSAVRRINAASVELELLATDACGNRNLPCTARR